MSHGDAFARGFFAAGLVSALVAAGAVIAGLAQIDGSIPDDVEGPIEALLVAKANIALFGFAAFLAVGLGLLWLAVVAQAGTEFTTGDGLSRLVATFIVWGAELALIGLVGATRFWMETPAAADAPQTQNAGPEGPAS